MLNNSYKLEKKNFQIKMLIKTEKVFLKQKRKLNAYKLNVSAFLHLI